MKKRLQLYRGYDRHLRDTIEYSIEQPQIGWQLEWEYRGKLRSAKWTLNMINACIHNHCYPVEYWLLLCQMISSICRLSLTWEGPDVRGAWLLCTLFTSSNNYLFLSFSIVKAGKSSPPTQGNPACSSRIIVDVSIQPHDVWLAKIWPLSKGLVWLETSIHFDETLLHLSRMQDMYSRVTREWPESFLEVAHATTELLVSDILHFRMQPSFPNSSPAKVSLSVLRVWRTVYSSTTYYSLHVIEAYIILRPPYKVYGYLAFANNIQSTTTITVQ